MQTISSLSERLDMTAEEALEKLRYLEFDIPDVDAEISDEQCDLLIDIDDDPSIADEIRQKNIEKREKAKKAAQKAAAKRKAAAKKKAAAAKKKAEEEAKAAPAEIAGEAPPAEAPPVTPREVHAAQILTGAEARAVEKAIAENIVNEAAEAAATAERKKKKEKPEGPAIVIGSAIEHDEHRLEVVRADGTHVEVDKIDIPADEADALAGVEEGEEDIGLLAEAERRQEEEERRRGRQPAKGAVRPDPAVVAEVIRKAKQKQERESEKKAEVPESKRQRKPRGPVPTGTRKTGKTARKRQKKLEKVRAEETMRREAAAAIREYQAGGFDATKKKRKKRRDGNGEALPDSEAAQIIEVEDVMTVEQLADEMGYETTDIILELMELNVMATKNQTLSVDLIREIAEPKGFEVVSVIPREQEILAEEPDDPADLIPRAPVVTVMGHVDHGKTSLLDRVREASVAAGESGGITQHIAAYDVELESGRVVFLDTPGHEAFTAMRARGAQITDVVVLVVAADDGVMPQTIEAIDHAQAAEVPIVVAINKIDKPNAQPERIRQELTRFNLTDEQWGGKTIMKGISALTGEGVNELMELLSLETELLELKANPKKRPRGTVIEAEISRGLGPVAWVLVQSGTLSVGDAFLAGETYGRVRSMQDSRGKNIESAGPSTPVVVTGFSSAAQAGDTFVGVEEERIARAIAEKRVERSRMRSGPAARRQTLEEFHEQMLAGEKHELNLLIKADVQGSVDVLESSMSKLGNEEVKVRIIHSGVGGINESDVMLASASDAVILGFHVDAAPKVQKVAENEGVTIRSYKVIYEAIQDVHNALEGLLTPEESEVVTGHAEVRATFKSSALGVIAGCYVRDGEIRRDAMVRVLRDGKSVFEGKIGSLRREKDDVTTVQTGYECGIKVAGFDSIAEGDIIEAYKMQSVAKTLA